MLTDFMDLENASVWIDRKHLWHVQRINGVGGHLLEGIGCFYKDVSSVLVNDELSESLCAAVGVRQRCVLSLGLFTIYIEVV